jgi:hypothetical protein
LSKDIVECTGFRLPGDYEGFSESVTLQITQKGGGSKNICIDYAQSKTGKERGEGGERRIGKVEEGRREGGRRRRRRKEEGGRRREEGGRRKEEGRSREEGEGKTVSHVRQVRTRTNSIQKNIPGELWKRSKRWITITYTTNSSSIF